MARMTNKILEAKVENINLRLGLNGDGSFCLTFGCGGVRLHKMEESGGLSDVSNRVTKTEMANILDTLYDVIVRFNLKVN